MLWLQQLFKKGFSTPCNRSLIIPIIKIGDKNDSSNYQSIMIDPLLAKLNGIILEKNINEWLEMEGKQDKGQEGFIRHNSTMDHLIMLNIIVEECSNNKYDLFFLWI